MGEDTTGPARPSRKRKWLLVLTLGSLTFLGLVVAAILLAPSASYSVQITAPADGCWVLRQVEGEPPLQDVFVDVTSGCGLATVNLGPCVADRHFGTVEVAVLQPETDAEISVELLRNGQVVDEGTLSPPDISVVLSVAC